MNRAILIVCVMVGLGSVPLVTLSTAEASLIVEVSPPFPDTSTPVAIVAWTWFGDPGQTYVQTTYSRSGFDIDVTVMMQDLHEPGSVWAQVIMSGGGSIVVGTLPKGEFSVDATILMIPWYGGFPAPYDSGSTSFEVTPEPATFTLLTLGGMALVRRRKRSACR
jgi:hypothetical protein